MADSFQAYPPIEKHGVIGDRRTAALVAADGSLNWLCLPDYDGPAVFGSLLDQARGGNWRFGPVETSLGRQHYFQDTAALVTTWLTPTGELELSDVMAWPENERPRGQEDCRIILRRLRCLQGEVSTTLQFYPRFNFETELKPKVAGDSLIFRLGKYRLELWATFPLLSRENGAEANLTLKAGDEAWAVLACNAKPGNWNLAKAHDSFATTLAYWRDWRDSISYDGPRREQVKHSAMILHLLSYAPTGGPVAAPTTSLPERLGGDRNYDYRYAWIRDASLALSILSILGETRAAQRYMDCLATMRSATESPLQVVYRVNGEIELPESLRTDLEGYRGSLPVRFGNRAYKQRQLDSLGFMVECAATYLERGCHWNDRYWRMIREAVEYTIKHWQQPDSGMWEMPFQCHFVSSKVMSWTVLDRAIQVGEKIGYRAELDGWRQIKDQIHAEVMECGWSEELQSFRQCYEKENVDASLLVIPIMGFLPPDHPRVLATLERIGEVLTINNFVHRYIPSKTHEGETRPVGEFEGAFLPATFWLAHALARAGRVEQAEAIIASVEAICPETGLFAEEVDARSGSYLGNMPLLFSHAEYLAAVITLAEKQGYKLPPPR